MTRVSTVAQTEPLRVQLPALAAGPSTAGPSRAARGSWGRHFEQGLCEAGLCLNRHCSFRPLAARSPLPSHSPARQMISVGEMSPASMALTMLAIF